MAKDYLTAFINNSSTIRDALAAEIEGAPHKAVTYNENGQLILPAADGDPVLGFILSDAPFGTEGKTPAGAEVDVIIKNIGLGEAASEIKKGDFVTATTTGKLQKVAEGNFILGVALTAAAAEGELVQVQITKSGYEKAGE